MPGHPQLLHRQYEKSMKVGTRSILTLTLGVALALQFGCQSPYYADKAALVGGLGGAGVGALVGNAVGNTGAGAAIGAGVGALSGGAIGGALDDIQARNRAEIAAQLGRPVAQGAATMYDVIDMTRAGVDPQLIANYVHSSGVAQPITAQDVIYLHQQGVATYVIQAMQTPRVAQAPVAVVTPERAQVIVEEYYFGRPYFGPRHFHDRHHHGPRVGWGVSFSN
jgi:hypothetical protein